MVFRAVSLFRQERDRQGKNFPIIIRCVINRLNFASLPAMMEFVHDIGATAIVFRPVQKSPGKVMSEWTTSAHPSNDSLTDNFWLHGAELDSLDQIKDCLIRLKRRLERLRRALEEGGNVITHLLTRVVGVGVETADMLVHEVFTRNLRDRKAVARYAGLTGAPDESGKRRRERGLAKSGNARVRRGMLQVAWGFLVHQKDSPLAAWYRARTADARGATRKTMNVQLARKLLIALWRLATTGEAPSGLVLGAAA
jgi:transposase